MCNIYLYATLLLLYIFTFNIPIISLLKKTPRNQQITVIVYLGYNKYNRSLGSKSLPKILT